MDFRISDTFTGGLARLTNDEQKAVKTTAFDLQMNPANPGHQFHKLDRAKDKHFWSVRVSRDIRLIVHKTDDGLLLCYVGHHNDAYAWAERRKIERHPKTGAAQLVEIRERVEEIVVPTYVDAPRLTKAKPTLFVNASDDELLSYGVPPEWLTDVKGATEDTLFEVADHLPREAAEALLELAIGNKPATPKPVPVAQNPFEHPAALQRFRLMTNTERAWPRTGRTVGNVGRLPPSGPAGARREALRRPGPCGRIGGNGQDGRGLASSRLLGSKGRQNAGLGHDVFADARADARSETERARRRRGRTSAADRGPRDRRVRRRALFEPSREAHDRVRGDRTGALATCRYEHRGARIQRVVPLERVELDRRRVAGEDMGRIQRLGATGPQDAARRSSAATALGDSRSRDAIVGG